MKIIILYTQMISLIFSSLLVGNITDNRIKEKEETAISLMRNGDLRDFDQGIWLIKKGNLNTPAIRSVLLDIIKNDKRKGERIDNDYAVWPKWAAAGCLANFTGYYKLEGRPSSFSQDEERLSKFKQWYEKNYPNHELLTEKPKEASTVESTISEAMAETPVKPVVVSEKARKEVAVDNAPVLETKHSLWPYAVLVVLVGGVLLLRCFK